jgi:hypothetical protein
MKRTLCGIHSSSSESLLVHECSSSYVAFAVPPLLASKADAVACSWLLRLLLLPLLPMLLLLLPLLLWCSSSAAAVSPLLRLPPIALLPVPMRAGALLESVSACKRGGSGRSPPMVRNLAASRAAMLLCSSSRRVAMHHCSCGTLMLR